MEREDTIPGSPDHRLVTGMVAGIESSRPSPPNDHPFRSFVDRIRWRYWQVRSYLLLDHSTLRWPWLWRTDSAVSLLHRVALESEWRTSDPCARLLLWISGLTWPVRAVLLVAAAVTRYRNFAIGSWQRQFWRVLWTAIRHNVPPQSYYRFRMFAAGDPEAYLHGHEVNGIFERLNGSLRVDTVDDKVEFARACRFRGLPAAAVIASFWDGRLDEWVQADRLPSDDLVVKFSNLWGGEGIERWGYEAPGSWRRGSERVSETELLAHCCRRSLTRPVIVQRRLRNHHILRGLAPQGLSTVRVVTHLPRKGSPQILLACLRMPVGDSVVDNFGQGGIAAPVDLRTGVLGTAVFIEPRAEFTNHPTTAAPISGIPVPQWSETCKLVLDAHQHFTNVAFIGWDVVIGEEGPMLLEANSNWGFDVVQIPTRTALGETWFPGAVARHLEVRAS